MEIKRKVYSALQEWKQRSDKKPLILRGLRQTGKTTIAFAFANSEYENAFYVDFRQQKSAHLIFDGDFDIDTIAMALTALPRDKRLTTGSALIPHKTLLVFDEIQDCPNARSSLKYFEQDGRFDVLCTGSVLGIKGYRRSKKTSRGIGVGSEEHLTMQPLDFEEFMWASGMKKEVTDLLRSSFSAHRPILPFYHEQLSTLFRQYIVVGGMPEAVSKFFETHDLGQVRTVLRRLIHDYESDFGTHLNDDLELVVDDTERALIGDAFHSIPRQLAKENKKFQYNVIKHNGDARTYGFAVQYLEDYGLVRKARNLSTLENPLDWFEKEDQFKIYLCDTGLFLAMLEDDVPSLVLSGNLGIGKGMIYENIFAETYSKMGRALHYYRRESGLEIDFVDSFDGEITLIEIMAKSGSTKASSTLLGDEKCKAKHLIRISASNIGFIKPILTIPHYLCFLLGEGFRWEK